MRSHRITAWSVITILAVAACTSDGSGGEGNGGGAGDAPPMSDVAAEEDGTGTAVTLSWQPVEDAETYRLGADHAAAEIPASLCDADGCAVTIGPELADEDGRLPVSAVTEDGAVSEPSVTELDTPPDAAPAPEDTPDLPLEVVQVTHTGDTPEVDVIPVDSPEEAERLIEEAPADTETTLNTPVVPQTATQQTVDAVEDEAELLATWHTEALRHDLLPGDPPGDGVVVAVVEAGGVDASHPALDGTVQDGLHVTDDGATGVSEPANHATATASLVAGQAEGGVPGTAPGATVLPVALGEEPTAADLMDGIIAAVDQGADLINVSVADLSCTDTHPASCDNLAGFEAVAAYANEQDALIVAAAGNNGPGESVPGAACAEEGNVNNARLPAALDSVLTVGAHTSTGEPWECTPERSDVNVLAPGRNLLVAQSGGGFAVESGTSLAAPVVSGFLAALKAEYPWLNSEAIRQRVVQWGGIGQPLDPVATLLDVGDLEPEEVHGAADGVTAVHPYELGLAFSAGHGVHDAINGIQDIQTTSDLTVEYYWGQHPFGGTSGQHGRDFEPFGIVSGAIHVYEDGTAEATASWTHTRLHSRLTSSETGRDLYGYRANCLVQRTSASADMGLMGARAKYWDMPVDVTVEPTGEEDARGWPTADITVELGEPPEPTVSYDTWEKCPGQVQQTLDAARRVNTASYEEQNSQMEEFFDLAQQAHEEAAADYRFESVALGSDAIDLRYDDVEDPWAAVGFDYTFGP